MQSFSWIWYSRLGKCFSPQASNLAVNCFHKVCSKKRIHYSSVSLVAEESVLRPLLWTHLQSPDFFIQFSQNVPHALAVVSYCANSKCAGKSWPRRIQQKVKRQKSTTWDWSCHVWSSRGVTYFLKRFLPITFQICGASPQSLSAKKPRHFETHQIGSSTKSVSSIFCKFVHLWRSRWNYNYVL